MSISVQRRRKKLLGLAEMTLRAMLLGPVTALGSTQGYTEVESWANLSSGLWQYLVKTCPLALPNGNVSLQSTVCTCCPCPWGARNRQEGTQLSESSLENRVSVNLSYRYILPVVTRACCGLCHGSWEDNTWWQVVFLKCWCLHITLCLKNLCSCSLNSEHQRRVTLWLRSPVFQLSLVYVQGSLCVHKWFS